MDQEELDLLIEKDIEEQILYEAISDGIDLDESQPNIDTEETNNQKKKKKRKYVAILKSDIKIKTVLILLLTLIVNTYAWFIYITTVSTSLRMHVKSWDFELTSGDESRDFVFTVDQIYPGMEESIHEINAKNNGETEAELTCEVYYVKIMDEVYQIGDDMTSDELLNKIMNDYPFKINLYLNDTLYDGKATIMQTGAQTTITLKVTWDYETGINDAEIEEGDIEDTYWGEKSYEFMETNPDEYSIEVKVNIQAIQHNE